MVQSYSSKAHPQKFVCDTAEYTAVVQKTESNALWFPD